MSGRISVDSLMGVRAAVLANQGIAIVEGLVFQDKNLAKLVERVLPDYEIDPLSLNLLFLENKLVPIKSARCD